MQARFLTLGGWSLRGGSKTLARQKPLLLLAYLLLEGSSSRRALRELFWGGGNDPDASLRSALHQLRSVAPDGLHDDGWQLSATVPSDIGDLLAAAKSGEHGRVLKVYRGNFGHGTKPQEFNPALQTWLETVRARVTGAVVNALVALHSSGNGDRARFKTTLNLLPLETCDPDALEGLSGVMRDLGQGLEPELLARLEGLRSSTVAAVEPALIGRESELEHLAALVSDGARLITVCGLGGVGKTTLVRHWARGLAKVTSDVTSDVTSVRLEGQGGNLRERISEALGKPADSDAALIATVSGTSALTLVLDDLGNDQSDLELLRDLIDGSPVRVVVTARRRLGWLDEHVLDLRGLASESSPSSGTGSVPALQLFERAARRHQPTFTINVETKALVLELAELVGGLPLALELAAALLRVLTLPELVTELGRDLGLLDDALEGRGPRGVFQQSWVRLNGRARETLTGFTAFPVSATKSALTVVLNTDAPTLRTLVDHALLRRREDSRYELHPLIRQFAARERATLGADTWTQKHAQYVLAWLEGMDAQVSDATTTQAVGAEFENIAAAFTVPEVLAVHLERLGNLATHLDRLGRHREAKRLFEDAVQEFPQARGFRADLAWFAFRLGEQGRATDLCDEVLRGVARDQAAMKAHNVVGNLHLNAERYSDAAVSLEAALAIAKELGDERRGANYLGSLAVCALGNRQFDLASSHFDAARHASRACGDRAGALLAVIQKGHLEIFHRVPQPEIVATLEAALNEALEMGAEGLLPHLHLLLGYAHLEIVDLEQASRHARQALEWGTRQGNPVFYSDAQMLNYWVQYTLGNHQEAAHLAKIELASAIERSQHRDALLMLALTVPAVDGKRIVAAIIRDAGKLTAWQHRRIVHLEPLPISTEKLEALLMGFEYEVMRSF